MQTTLPRYLEGEADQPLRLHPKLYAALCCPDCGSPLIRFRALRLYGCGKAPHGKLLAYDAVIARVRDAWKRIPDGLLKRYRRLELRYQSEAGTDRAGCALAQWLVTLANHQPKETECEEADRGRARQGDAAAEPLRAAPERPAEEGTGICTPCAKRGMFMTARVVRDGVGLCDDCARQAPPDRPTPDQLHTPLRDLSDLSTDMCDRLQAAGYRYVGEIDADSGRLEEMIEKGQLCGVNAYHVRESVRRFLGRPDLSAAAPLPVPPVRVPASEVGAFMPGQGEPLKVGDRVRKVGVEKAKRKAKGKR